MTDVTPANQPAPGWYADAVTDGLLRYWDGNRWTDQTRPVDAPGFATYGDVVESDQTSTAAIASLACSLAWLPVTFFVFPVGGLVLLASIALGIVGINDTKDGRKKGRGLAIAGLVIGSLSLLLAILGVIAVVVFAASLFETLGTEVINEVANELPTAIEQANELNQSSL